MKIRKRSILQTALLSILLLFLIRCEEGGQVKVAPSAKNLTEKGGFVTIDIDKELGVNQSLDYQYSVSELKGSEEFAFILFLYKLSETSTAIPSATEEAISLFIDNPPPKALSNAAATKAQVLQPAPPSRFQLSKESLIMTKPGPSNTPKPKNQQLSNDETTINVVQSPTTPNYEIVTAVRYLEKDDVVAFVDKNDNDNKNFDKDLLNQVINHVQDTTLPRTRKIFGAEAPEATGITASTTNPKLQDGKITLFFSKRFQNNANIASFDFHDTLQPTPSSPASNQQYIIYSAFPESKDPNQITATTVKTATSDTNSDLTVSNVTAAITFEIQKLINFSRNYLIQVTPFVTDTSGFAEKLFLNQALSLLAADLSGFPSLTFKYTKAFLDAPSQIPLFSDATSFEAIGLNYLFLRFLVDQSGPLSYASGRAADISGRPLEITTQFIGSSKRGLDNILAAAQQGGKTLYEWIEAFYATLVLDQFDTVDRRFESPITDPITRHTIGIRLNNTRSESLSNQTLTLSSPKLSPVPNQLNQEIKLTLKPFSAVFYSITSNPGTMTIRIKGDRSPRYRLGAILVRLSD